MRLVQRRCFLTQAALKTVGVQLVGNQWQSALPLSAAVCVRLAFTSQWQVMICVFFRAPSRLCLCQELCHQPIVIVSLERTKLRQQGLVTDVWMLAFYATEILQLELKLP